MVNIDDFIKRLEIILDYHNLNASSFADKIGVQRSSMSHLLSGRNKPSLDFILKVLDVFPDVDLYWILNGKGTFPKSDKTILEKKETPSFEKKDISPILPIPKNDSENLFSEIEISNEKKFTKNNVEKKLESVNENLENSEIEKIVFFYKNGTCKIFTT